MINPKILVIVTLFIGGSLTTGTIYTFAQDGSETGIIGTDHSALQMEYSFEGMFAAIIYVYTCWCRVGNIILAARRLLLCFL